MAYRLAFVMEQTLGHITHAQNFRYWVERDPDVVPTWIPVSYSTVDGWSRTPFVGANWTLRSSLRARTKILAALKTQALDGLFFHTQVTALFAHRLMTRIPTVVSMDATPLNFDRIGVPYNHHPNAFQPVESFKNRLTRRTFTRAKCLVTWHEWGKASLVADYGVSADKVEVIPPGIDLQRWTVARSGHAENGLLRLLFVGGDFRRKGGEALLAAFRRDLTPYCHLDIVTHDEVDTAGLANVRVHHGMGPNVPGLMALYAQSDVFVFPTLADVLPLAIMEAMATGLPIITTNVGAITEQVEDGVTGLLVAPNDVDALSAAVLRVVHDASLRRELGAAARRTADLRFNGSRNYPRLLKLCKACVDRGCS